MDLSIGGEFSVLTVHFNLFRYIAVLDIDCQKLFTSCTPYLELPDTQFADLGHFMVLGI